MVNVFSRRSGKLAELAFRDGIMDQIRLRDARFHEHAYLFVLASLEFYQSRLSERRHIDGPQLAFAVSSLVVADSGTILVTATPP